MLECSSAAEVDRIVVLNRVLYGGSEIFLNRWSPVVGRTSVLQNRGQVWITAKGLPLHLRSVEVFKGIGDACGGYVEHEASGGRLSFARIKVSVKQELPRQDSVLLRYRDEDFLVPITYGGFDLRSSDQISRATKGKAVVSNEVPGKLLVFNRCMDNFLPGSYSCHRPPAPFQRSEQGMSSAPLESATWSEASRDPAMLPRLARTTEVSSTSFRHTQEWGASIFGSDLGKDARMGQILKPSSPSDALVSLGQMISKYGKSPFLSRGGYVGLVVKDSEGILLLSRLSLDGLLQNVLKVCSGLPGPGRGFPS
ncbi:hypothetical protein LINPERHAP2_LOCUS3457 [Linum perenne]